MKLIEAIDNNNLKEVIRIIRSDNINLESINDEDDLSPLHHAVSRGYKEIVISMLEHGADVNLCNDEVCSPLHIAIKNDNVEMVQLLIDNGADTDCCNNTIHGTPLQCAILNENYRITDALLESGADTHEIYTKNHPIIEAIKLDNLPLVRLLLRHGADVNTFDPLYGYPIHLAIRYGNIDIIKELLYHGVIESYSLYPSLLHQSIMCNNKEVVLLLISMGFDVNAKDNEGNTPMHLAVQKNLVGIVKILLDKGADTSIINNLSVTCLRSCYVYGNNSTEILQLLISRIVINKYANIPCRSIAGMNYNWSLIESNQKTNSYKLECEKEILKMLDVKIGSRSLFDIYLNKIESNMLLRLYNNVTLPEFIIYKDIIINAVYTAKERESLISKSFTVLEDTISNDTIDNLWKNIPIEVKYMILRYLGKDDLYNIVNSV
ncbi:ankyrin repeat family protein [Fowlpox virus]|uniref:Ankyrin repeat family protein n=1 Tax=Fowlpox virus TaxID=10261 RepID=A0A891LWW1_FOWPV|nr:ankyrin repeat family protein [Fowlpox virus]UHJ14965.1 ankyrin repeat family protein [Fowlpox virus]UHJ15222.1 ankyrin repeat family protein [Fowlpox virus]